MGAAIGKDGKRRRGKATADEARPRTEISGARSVFLRQSFCVGLFCKWGGQLAEDIPFG